MKINKIKTKFYKNKNLIKIKVKQNKNYIKNYKKMVKIQQIWDQIKLKIKTR